jgi:hypothetical protein
MASFVAVSIATAISNALSSESSLIKESTCNQCHRKGHIRAACRSGEQKKKPQHRYQRVHALNHEENDDLEIYSVYSHGV